MAGLSKLLRDAILIAVAVSLFIESASSGTESFSDQILLLEIKKIDKTEVSFDLVISHDLPGIVVTLDFDNKQVGFVFNQTAHVRQGAVPMGFALLCPNREPISLGVDTHLSERKCEEVWLDTNRTRVRSENRMERAARVEWRIVTPQKPRSIEVRDFKNQLLATMRPFSPKECKVQYESLLALPFYDDPSAFRWILYPLFAKMGLFRSKKSQKE